MKEEEEE